MISRWQMAWCFLRGGAHVLDPDFEVYKYARPIAASADYAPSSGTSPESEKPRSDFDVRSTSSVRSFLWRHDLESDEEFGDRARRLYHLGIYRSFINVYTAGILKVPPKRGRATGAWKRYEEDADGQGTAVNTLVRRALSLALCWGRVHAVTDREAIAEAPRSAAESDVAPPPYSFLLSPIDVVDWRRNRNGRFVWFVYREDAPDERDPGEEQPDALNQYRVLTENTSELWREVRESNVLGVTRSFEKIGPTTYHNLGRVPVSTLWATEEERERVMGCESPFADALDFDRHLLNKMSESDETERTQAFSLLAWPVAEGGVRGSLDVGPNRAVAYSSDVGTPSYISPDPSVVDGVWKRAEGQIQMVRTLEGASRGRAEYSKEERSAASITVESEDKRNRMTWWAAAVEEFDRDLHDVAGLWIGAKPPTVSYTKDFDFRAVTAQIADIVQLNVLQLPRKAIFELAKSPVTAILRENGVEADVLDRVLAVIDEEMEKPEPKPIIQVPAPFGKKPAAPGEEDEEKPAEEVPA